MFKLLRFSLLAAFYLLLTGCDDLRVYGSVGYSNFSGYPGYYGGGRYGTSISVGGRIY